MFFSDYKDHKEASLRKSLLWEYDLSLFDWNTMRNVVVQRVVERGWKEDYYAILNMYGLKGVKEAIREIPYLNEKDTSFVIAVFGIKKEELRCYIKKQSTPQHWNS